MKIHLKRIRPLPFDRLLGEWRRDQSTESGGARGVIEKIESAQENKHFVSLLLPRPFLYHSLPAVPFVHLFAFLVLQLQLSSN